MHLICAPEEADVTPQKGDVGQRQHGFRLGVWLGDFGSMQGI